MSEAVANTQQPTAPQTPGAVADPYAGTKHKVKIDDKEIEVSYEDLKADYQQKVASQKRFDQADKIRKEVDGLFESMKKGDLSFLKQVVPPEVLRKFSEKELLDYIDWEKKPQSERDAITAQKERDQYKQQLEEKTKAEEEFKIQQIQHQTDVEIEQEIIDAVKSLGHDIKVTPRLVRRIAEQMQASLQASPDLDGKHMPAKVAAERAWRGLKKDHEEYLGLIKPEDYIAMVPKKLREAIRRADVDSVISQTPQSVRSSNQPSDKSEPRVSGSPKLKRMSTDDWFSRMEKTITKRG